MRRTAFFVIIALGFLGFGLAQQPAAKPDMRIRVSERVLDGIAVKKVLPKVPLTVDKAHQQGTVRIAVLVDYDGT